MTVQELMEVLKQLDPNTELHVWDHECGCVEPINEIEVDQDGKVVIY